MVSRLLYIVIVLLDNFAFGEMYSGLTNIKDAPSKDIDCKDDMGKLECTGDGDMKGINTYLSQQEKEIPIALFISLCKFSDGLMKVGWISVDNIQLILLEVKNCELTNIENSAFNHQAFSKLEMLSLKELKIQKFSDQTFTGLAKLEMLDIQMDSEFESQKLLEPLKNLSNFVFKRTPLDTTESFNIKKLLETTHPNKIKLLELESINIGAEFSTQTDVFKTFPTLETLKLVNCNIQRITKTNFEVLEKSLKTLSLKQNKLQSIPRNIFKFLLEKDNFDIDLSENLWECNCNLIPLVEDIVKYPRKFIPMPLCYGPPILNNKPISTAELICSNIICNIDDCDQCGGVEYPKDKNYLQMNGPEVDITTQNITSTKINVTTNTNISTENFAVIWFDINLIKNYKSNSNLKLYSNCKFGTENKKIIIDNLTPNRTYTICLIKFGSSVISPYNCHSYNNPELIEVNNFHKECKVRIAPFVGFGISVILSACLGSSAVYFTIQRNPTLLKGSKRVCIVKIENKGIFVMPNNIVGKNRCETLSNIRRRRFSDSNISINRRNSEMSHLYEEIEYRKVKRPDKELSSWKNNEILQSVSPPSPPPFTRRYLTILEKPNSNEIETDYYSGSYVM